MKKIARPAFAIILLILIPAGLAACQNPAWSSPPSPPPADMGSPAMTPGASTPSDPADPPDNADNTGNGSSDGVSPASPPSAPDSKPGSESESKPGPEPKPEPAPEPEPEPVEVRSIVIELSTGQATKGMVLEPRIVIRPADATEKSYTLKSSDESVLRVSDGRITAVGAGTAEVIATARNGVTGTAAITVTVPVETFSIGVRTIAINRGESTTLSPVITPADATDQHISFMSDNVNVASVSDAGVIQGVSAGTSVITGTVGGFSDTCTVTVIVPVTSVSISADKRAYKVGDNGGFTVQISPQDATDKTFTVSISGEAVTLTGDTAFSCDAGGDATITVTAANGVSARQTISVVDLVAFAEEVLRLTNIERANSGLSALSTTPELTRTAVVRANEIIRSFSHDRPDGSSCFTAYDENNVSYGWAGENIAMGQRTPEEVVRAWMNSPGHKANILKKEFGRLGVGVAMDNNGRLHWSQNFTD